MNSTESSVWYFPNISLVIDLHNKARSESNWLRLVNYHKLVIDNRLMDYAKQWAYHMSEQEKLYHSDMRDIMKLGFSSVGENILSVQNQESIIIKTWLQNPKDKANILSSVFDSIGCAFSYSDSDIIYWCVCFGKSKVRRLT